MESGDSDITTTAIKIPRLHINQDHKTKWGEKQKIIGNGEEFIYEYHLIPYECMCKVFDILLQGKQNI